MDVSIGGGWYYYLLPVIPAFVFDHIEPNGEYLICKYTAHEWNLVSFYVLHRYDECCDFVLLSSLSGTVPHLNVVQDDIFPFTRSMIGRNEWMMIIVNYQSSTSQSKYLLLEWPVVVVDLDGYQWFIRGYHLSLLFIIPKCGPKSVVLIWVCVNAIHP